MFYVSTVQYSHNLGHDIWFNLSLCDVRLSLQQRATMCSHICWILAGKI